MSENALTTFKTSTKDLSPTIGASLETSLVRLGTNAAASTYTFNRVIFLTSEPSRS